mmetsp:Transcript_10207/g.12623  ORF Transcript_10207/g.12623 Transcript_10207/m.12623 type:complete len:238 (+) Transcript_10207:99-812(+)|eukprot:CAMPEP_0172516036 /NCGR_PEP_ID=MMETSP1066-20121228/272788_1 /TAXON_ID=671091 /ORGANISM="Coscinodiscus wailesii, Strain CCMP2513" /LENGTH=237 /DNA_ID=CAMNT_0013297351 /DNA_START=99 /DNA_END=812 /DNA_ORIENTATION=-
MMKPRLVLLPAMVCLLSPSSVAKHSKATRSMESPKLKDLFGCTPSEMAYFHHWVSAFYSLQADATEEITLSNGDFSGPLVAAYYAFNEANLSPNFTFTIDNYIYNFGRSPTVFVPGLPNSVNYYDRDSYLYGSTGGLPSWVAFVSNGGNIMQNNNGVVTYPVCDRESGTVVVKSRAVDFSQGFSDTDEDGFLESNIGLAWGASFRFEPDENNELVCVSYIGKSSGYATVEYENNLGL